MKSYFFCRNSESANFQPYLFFLAFPFLCSALLVSCKEDEEKPGLTAVDLRINGNNLSITDSIIFIQNNDSVKLVEIQNPTTNGFLYYSVNNSKYELSSQGIINISNGDSLLQFYFVKEGHQNSEIRTILFSEYADRFLHPINFYPNPTDSIIYLEEVNKTRGEMNLSIFDIQGRKYLKDSYNKNADTLALAYNLYHFKAGFYIFSLQYGASKRNLKLLIDN